MNATTRKRVIFAGIDGATWEIIEPMVAEGKLPNLAAMMKAGTRGILQSTSPPNSSLAWASMQTGVHPGKHGVFFFREQCHGSYQRPVISWNSIQAPSMWKLASDEGKKVCVVTMPLTFPVEKINGCMVGGLLTPDRASDFIWPPELREELEEAIGDVPADNEPEKVFHSSDEEQAGACLSHVIEQITRMGEHLLETKDPDLFALVFRQVDLASHQTWCFQDPEWAAKHPEAAAQRKDNLASVYETVDAAFGRLRDKALEMDGEVVFATCSDHGFGPIHYRYHLNKWLLDEGYLVLKSGAGFQKLRIFIQRKWTGLLRRTGVLGWLTSRGRALPKGQEQIIMDMVDWSKTRAYSSFSGGEDIILINLKGREPEGIVEPGQAYETLRDEIIAKAKEIRAEDGTAIIDKAVRREDMWHGPQVDLAPDIQMVTYDTSCNMGPNPLAPCVVEPAWDGRPAMHRMEGVYMFEGKGVIRREAVHHGPQIADMTPTMLHLLGLPIDDHMDGSVMEEILEPAWAAANPIQERKGHVELKAASAQTGDMSSEDEQKLIETMQALGYME